MTEWFLEPGHTAVEFRARHMMVCYVRGHFKNIHGRLLFDPANPRDSRVEIRIDAGTLWTGEPQRDAHLRSADFFDVEHYPEITFTSNHAEIAGGHDYVVTGPLTIRGITRDVFLNVRYLGQWQTPWWENGVDKDPRIRAGFLAETTINRQDFGVSWNGSLEKGGVVIGNRVEITVDAEAIMAAPASPVRG